MNEDVILDIFFISFNIVILYLIYMNKRSCRHKSYCNLLLFMFLGFFIKLFTNLMQMLGDLGLSNVDASVIDLFMAPMLVLIILGISRVLFYVYEMISEKNISNNIVFGYFFIITAISCFFYYVGTPLLSAAIFDVTLMISVLPLVISLKYLKIPLKTFWYYIYIATVFLGFNFIVGSFYLPLISVVVKTVTYYTFLVAFRQLRDVISINV